jgi:hypothetical protein
VDREPGDLAGEIPERHVHGADGSRRRGAAPLPEGVVESLARQGILAEDGHAFLGSAMRGAQLDAVSLIEVLKPVRPSRA